MIRSIIYLDEPKFFSLSSQVFEGVTEYLLNEKSKAHESEESQKGPVASGRTLADALKFSESSTEKRVLHDHAFAIFEDKLLAESQLAQVSDAVSATEARAAIQQRSFVRVEASATIVDATRLTSIFSHFNELGEALAYVTGSTAALASLAKAAGKPASAIPHGKVIAAIKDQTKASGLYQDPTFLASLTKVTEFGYADQLELQQTLNGLLYSSSLRREFLREPVDLLTRKYARRTEKKFIVFGLVTQRAQEATSVEMTGELTTKSSMKEAIANMVNHVAQLESSLAGKSSNEIVIDPIAVYVPL